MGLFDKMIGLEPRRGDLTPEERRVWDEAYSKAYKSVIVQQGHAFSQDPLTGVLTTFGASRSDRKSADTVAKSVALDAVRDLRKAD